MQMFLPPQLSLGSEMAQQVLFQRLEARVPYR